ncbi:MAG: TetR/AcrR family transcriptional regulator [Amylibacter sp.]|nr:TetR/AcrR family transcriptional regulator [Amylibacter sp.]
MKTRLKKTDWVVFALKELAKYGHANLTAQNLAQKMGVSRGSFYWHFKDVREFENCVTREWQDISTEQIIQRLRGDNCAQTRLKNLLSQAMSADISLERAMRAWASTDARIAMAVADVDLRRITYVEDLLKELGIAKPERRVRALALYWASLGRIMIANPKFGELTADEVEQLKSLFVS